ncbi:MULTISPECIES: hypothetical protein [Giesbergeria]|uniref:Uncharacterized protein n=1 Tax=Giesbergeria sinuosa TaxID=80883 RepID=A0ABV9QCK2_9BURK
MCQTGMEFGRIRALCIAARQGEHRAWTELRNIGQQAADQGGVHAMCDLFWRFHDDQLKSSAVNPAQELSAAWESIPEWANL